MTNNDNITMTTEQRPTSMINDHGSRINNKEVPRILIGPGAPGLITERQRRAAYRRRPACPECRQDARPTNYARAAVPYSPNSSRHQPRPPVTCNLSPVTSSRPRRAAFSLAEILIAIFVLSIGLIMIAAVFPVAAKWTAQDAQTSVAQVIAKNAVAQIQAQGLIPAGGGAIGPYCYNFGSPSPYPNANPAPYPATFTTPPPGTYYWSAYALPTTYAAGSSGVFPGTPSNAYTIYVFVFSKGDASNVFATPPSPGTIGNATLAPMNPYPQNPATNPVSAYPQLYSGTIENVIIAPVAPTPPMPIGSLGLDTVTGQVFREIVDPNTNEVTITGIPTSTANPNPNLTSRSGDTIVYAPPAATATIPAGGGAPTYNFSTSSPLVYVYVTTVNL